MSLLIPIALACTLVTDVLSYQYFRRGFNEVSAGGRPAARLLALSWMFGGMAITILALASFNPAAYGLNNGVVFLLICSSLATFLVACCVGEARYKREQAEQDDITAV